MLISDENIVKAGDDYAKAFSRKGQGLNSYREGRDVVCTMGVTSRRLLDMLLHNYSHSTDHRSTAFIGTPLLSYVKYIVSSFPSTKNVLSVIG